jgi:ribosomal protein S18 acetylase RimI-like enzyme
LFVKEAPGFPYYARPIPGAPTPSAEEIAAVRARQRDLDVPETLEWIHDVDPSLIDVARGAGLNVREAPMLVLGEGRWRTPDPPDGVTVRLVNAGDPALSAFGAVQDVGFANPGTDVGEAGPRERDLAAVGRSAVELDFLSERIRSGLTQPAIAEDERGVVSAGSHQMVGDVTSITGVATLPCARRHGLGGLVTARLAQDARERGAAVIFIEAESADVARIYSRLGFERVGTGCVASAAR